MKNQKIISLTALLIASMGVAQAQLIISEVDPTGSSASYGPIGLNSRTPALQPLISQVGKWTTIPTLSARRSHSPA